MSSHIHQHLLPFIKMISNKKEHGKGISELMLHFDNVFLESNKGERAKGISESMLHFDSNAFLESNKKEQCVTQIGI